MKTTFSFAGTFKMDMDSSKRLEVQVSKLDTSMDVENEEKYYDLQKEALDQVRAFYNGFLIMENQNDKERREQEEKRIQNETKRLENERLRIETEHKEAMERIAVERAKYESKRSTDN